MNVAGNPSTLLALAGAAYGETLSVPKSLPNSALHPVTFSSVFHAQRRIRLRSPIIQHRIDQDLLRERRRQAPITRHDRQRSGQIPVGTFAHRGDAASVYVELTPACSWTQVRPA
ncbi:hypothetical protein BBP40_011006 [Aspergillus hancockii]|nr:hypothetical protein BBP40_011006 [Aspergillus hancockii]